MKKRKIAIISLITLLILSCFFIASCSKNSGKGNTSVEISVDGASKSNSITIYAKNIDTKEKVEIEVKKRDEYTSSHKIDCGDYTITKIKSNNKKYEIISSPSEFSVKDQSTDVITINVEEKDISGTLTWFLKNNAFTLTAIVGLSIALVIIKWKKRNFVTNDKTKMQ